MANAFSQPQGAPDPGAGCSANLFHQQGSQSIDLQRNRPTWLGDKIDRAEFDSFQRRIGAFRCQRGDHHNRPRSLDHDPAKASQAVHAGHLNIERYDLRIESTNQFEGLVAVTSHADVEVALCDEDAFEQLPHQGRVVGDQEPDHETVTGASSLEWANLARRSAST